MNTMRWNCIWQNFDIVSKIIIVDFMIQHMLKSIISRICLLIPLL